MNDIEKAMVFLREEHRQRLAASPVRAPEEDPASSLGGRPVRPELAPPGSGKRFDDERFERERMERANELPGEARDRAEHARGESESTGREPAERARAGGHHPTRTNTERVGRSVSLPLERLAAAGFVTPGLSKSRLSEEFRRVKRPILKNIADARATGGHRNVIMVTSSVAGEGKTYTSINLAMSLAMERERTVLLVDADVVKGTAGRMLGLDAGLPGLTDVLAGRPADIGDVMLNTDVPDFRLVPSGSRSEGTTELLSSTRMHDLVDELARRYEDRIIVLDCPPMLQTNEANILVDHAGQIVFVVAGQETDQRLVLEAINRFDADKSVGVLLNKASGASAAYGYDYHYG